MTFYINVPLSGRGLAEEARNMRTVDSRAQATELLHGDAAHLRGIAQERWPGLDWQIEYVRAARYVLKGEPKRDQPIKGGKT